MMYVRILCIVFFTSFLTTLVIAFIIYAMIFIREKKKKKKNQVDYRENEEFLKRKEFVNQIHFERIELEIENKKCIGYYHKGTTNRAIIGVHGYKSNAKRDFCLYGVPYFDLENTILLMDLRSHGASEGKLIGLSHYEQKDVLKWIEWLNQKDSDVKEIYLHGVSMGASTILLLCNQEMEKVKGIIADSGFTSMKDEIQYLFKTSIGIKIFPIYYEVEWFSYLVGKTSFHKESTLQTVKDSKYPILFIHSKADNFVPCKFTESLEPISKTGEFWYTENAPHVGSGLLYEEEYKLKVNEFIDKCSSYAKK